MSATLGSAESSVRALLVSDDPLTIKQISEPLRELAATTEVCTDVPSAIRLVNTRKFETVVVDLVRLSPSNHTTVAFAITEGTKQSAMAFAAGSNFVLERPLSAISVGRTLKAAYGLIIRERLRYFRCPISIPAAIRDQEAGEIRCQAVNISEGGMAVISSVPLKPGMQVTLQFAIPGQGSQFAAESEICWCDEKGRAGLRFGALSPEQKTDLKQWLSKRLEETLPESVALKFRSTC